MNNTKNKIAIIGGGITGLVAALRLAQGGHKVIVFERSREVGGLAAGFKIHGNNLEKAYHHLFQTDKEIIKFVKELNENELLHDLHLQWYESSMGLYNNDLFKFSTPIDLLKFKPLSLINRIRTGIVTLFLQKTKNWEKFKNTTATVWLNKWYGKNAYNIIWEPLLRGKFNTYYDKVSMAWFWARLFTRGNSRKTSGKEMLGYFDGGFNSLIQALVKKLKEFDVEIITGVEVEEVKCLKDETLSIIFKYSLQDKSLGREALQDGGNFNNLLSRDMPQHVSTGELVSTTGEQIINARNLDTSIGRDALQCVSTYKSVENSMIKKEIQFDKILATIPSPVFAKLIEKCNVSEKYIEKLNSIDYLGAINLIFSSDQDLSNYYWHNINDLNFPFLVFINHTKLIDKENYGGKYIYYIGGYYPHNHNYFKMNKDEISKNWFKWLAKIFPHFSEDKIIEKHLFKFRNAQHIVDTKYENKIPKYITPIKNLYLCNFSQIFPEDRGTNFAVREGNKIAKLMQSN